MQPDQVVAVAVALLAGSEILSLLPNVKSNGWVQLVLAVLKGIAATSQPPKR